MKLTVTTRPIDWRATVESGLIGGLLFLATGAVVLPILGLGTPLTLVKMIVPMIMGEDHVTRSLDASGFVIALTLHFGLAVAYAVALVALVNRLAPAPAVLVGAVFGLALYLVNFYIGTELFPWFIAARGVALATIHVVFGLGAAGAYELLERSHERREDALIHPH
jgi:hypothetical protein